MYLKKIKIKNFKSIYDELELDFENDICGFWKINGAVGAGKTSIGEAIIFGLYGDVKGKNNGDLISWGEKHSQIEVWCNSKGNSLYIKRELNKYGLSPIYVEVNNQELIFTNKKNAQKQLEEEYYDISRITLELLCIISFNNFKSLANLNTKDTKQFLDQVFGFYILTNYGEICKKLKIDSIEKKNFSISYKNNLVNQIDRLEKLSNIELIEGDMGELQKDLKIFTKEIRDLKTQRNESIGKLREKLSEYQNKLSEIKILGASNKKEIDFIKKGICPTCGSKIDQSKLQEKELLRNTLLESYNTTQQSIKEIEDNIKESKNNYDNKESIINKNILEINKKISQLTEQEKRIKISNDEINDIKKEVSITCEEINKFEKEEIEWDTLYNLLSNDIRYQILSSFIPLLNKSIRDYTIQFQLPYNIEFDNTFTCNINLYSIDQNVPISMLSTGQMKVVNISIILGVLKTIMNSVNFNICFLDELLSNMHADLRHDICQVLKKDLKPKQTIFIISHAELDEQYFNGSLNVKLVNEDGLMKSTYTKSILV